MRPTPLPPELLYRPFTLAQARAAGLGEGVVRGARFRRVLRGVYASVDLPESPALLIAGAFLIAPAGSFAVHSSAAYLYGLPDVTRTTHMPRIGLPPGVVKPRTSGIEWHPYGRAPSLAVVAGHPVTDPVSTFLDCAARLPLVDAVVIGDALVRRQRVTCDQLVSAAALVRGRAGLRTSRAAAYVRPRVDSPMETRLRLLIVLAGLPEPLTNVDAHGPSGLWLARPDLSWPRVKVSLEYDGIHHFADPTGRQRRSDNRRRTGMYDAGWVEIVVMSEDLLGDTWRLLERIRRVLAQRGLAGVPPQLCSQWREVAR